MAIRQTDELLKALLETKDRGASDMFMVPGEPVSFRVRGKLERGTGPALSAVQVREVAAAAVGEPSLDRVGASAAVAQTSCGVPGVIDGRLTVARSLGELSISVAVRIPLMMTPDQAGLPAPLVTAAEASHGLIVVAGPTGSGKVTAAYALLEHLNLGKAMHICTVEDTVAAFLTSKRCLVQQHEIGADVPDMATGIRACLLQDPDVIYVGVIEDEETADAAVAAAQTGHLVIATMHAVSPQEAVQRLIEMHAEGDRAAFRRALAQQLLAVSVQVLLPKASGKGRGAAFGLLVPDEPFRAAIREGRDVSSSPPPQGSWSLAHGIARQVADGKVTAEAAEAARGRL
jgi:twitching motility protein PilT